MTEPLTSLPPSDIAILREMVRAYRDSKQDIDENENTFTDDASHCFIALTDPDIPIPARAALVPGFGVCTVYKIKPATPGGVDYTLTPVTADTALSGTVFNTTLSDIPAATYIPIVQDRYGRWIAVTTSTTKAWRGRADGTVTWDNAATDISFDAEISTAAGYALNTGTGELTISLSGWQYFDVMLPYACPSLSQNEHTSLYLSRNGTPEPNVYGIEFEPLFAAGDHFVSWSGPILVVAGDVFKWTCIGSTSSPSRTLYTGSASKSNSWGVHTL